MKRLFIIVVTILVVSITTTTSAQVGINTTNPQSALDISSTNTVAPENTDGILIPRISNFPATNPGANQQSMLVYLTNDLINVNISGTPQDYDLSLIHI